MDTLNSYLVAVARSLMLSSDELSHINTSISFLQTRLNSRFGKSLKTHFRFGSSTRDTILPRKVDEDSDIDYMVVFENRENYKPATLLGWLKSFAESNYSRSEIYQSYPTIVLELSHIKFELVPAVQPYWWNDTYQIPAPSSNYIDWMLTSPSELKKTVDDANNRYNYQIKKLIRLLKYWNVRNGKVYSSFEIEEYVGHLVFWGCSTLEDYFFYAVEYLTPSTGMAQYKRDKVNSFKDKVADIKKDFYNNGYKYFAKSNLEKLLPMP